MIKTAPYRENTGSIKPAALFLGSRSVEDAGAAGKCSLDFYSLGNSLCEHFEQGWRYWGKSPVIHLPGLLSQARALLNEAKRPYNFKRKEELALQAVQNCERSIAAGTGVRDCYFVCAQALEIAYPHSHDEHIREYYEKSLAIKKHQDKYVSYAKFSYKRLKDYEKADFLFREARNLERKNNIFNIKGLNAQAEFYLVWEGHLHDAGQIINRVIKAKENRLLNLFLAARIFQESGLRFTAEFFYEAARELDPNHIPGVNSYANACLQWGDKGKAEALYEISYRLNQNNIPTLNAYAIACAEWGEEYKDKAVQFFDAALKINPGDVKLLNSYGHASIRWGEKAKGVALLEKEKRFSHSHKATIHGGPAAAAMIGHLGTG